MPVRNLYDNKSQSQLNAYGQQLQSVLAQMPDSPQSQNYKAFEMRNRGHFENFYKGMGKGGAKALESTINFIPDVLGAKDRWATFSDYIEDNPHSSLFQITEDAVQLLTGLVGGGFVLKGGKALFKGSKEVAEELRDQQLTQAGLRSQRKFSRGVEIAKQGALRGSIAESLAFRGQDETLLINHFFEKNPEWMAALEEVTASDDWANKSVPELGGQLAQSWHNIKGRGSFALEGMVVGALANFLMAGVKVGWRSATGQSDAALRKATAGEDVVGEAGADATEQQGLREGTKSARIDKIKEAQENAANKELSEASEKLEEATESVKEELNKGKPTGEPTQRDTNIVPEEADSLLEGAGTRPAGMKVDLDVEIYSKPPVKRETLTQEESAVLKEGLTALEKGVIKYDADAIAKQFDEAGKDLKKTTGDDRFNAQDIFGKEGGDDYRQYLIMKERSRHVFPQLKNESDKAYKLRLEKHAINEAKRNGLGHFYKYEFKAPERLKHLKLTQEEIRMMFKPEAEGKVKDFINKLRGEFKDAKGNTVRVSPQILLKEAEQILRGDTVFTDKGMQYFQNRLISFFQEHLSKNMESVSDADTFAKAVGYMKDRSSDNLGDIMESHLFDNLDDLAAATGLTNRSLLHRMMKGRGSFSQLFNVMDKPPLKVAATLDEKAMKDLNVRIMAYRMEHALSMRQYKNLSKKIAETPDDMLTLDNPHVKQYLLELEKQAAKIENLQKLRQASGRVLRAWRDISDKGIEKLGIQKLVAERGGISSIKKHAQRSNAIFEAADDELAGAAAASDYLTKTTNWIDVHNEYWINSILSGTRTQVVNMLSTGLHMYYKPLEGMIGSMGNSSARRGFTKTLVETAMINAQVTRIVGKLGLNKLQRLSKLIDEDSYMKNRQDIFAGGSGKATDSYQQALGAVAGARKSLRTGEGTLTKGADLFDVAPPRAITKDLLSENASEVAKGALDYIGGMVRLPSRLMIGADELFKQISFRAAAMGRLAADGIDQAAELGVKADAEYLADYVGTRFNGVIRASGKRYNLKNLKEEAHAEYDKNVEAALEAKATFSTPREEFIAQYVRRHQRDQLDQTSEMAMDYASDVTFTRSLDADFKAVQDYEYVEGLSPFKPTHIDKGKRSFLADMQDMVHRHPALRLLMPFMRTPINILKWPLQRMSLIATPRGTLLGSEVSWLKKMHLRYQADILSGDSMRAGAAKGRLYAGWFYWGGFMAAATTGTITGGGPSNPRARRNLMATGWRPYSVQVGDKYVSYARLDPFALPLGLAADLYEKVSSLGEDGDIDDNWLQATMMAAAYSLSNNMADKSYLAGINNVLQALVEPETKFTALVKKQGASYIPKLVSQWTPLTDDVYMKKTYGMLDTFMKNLPFANSSIEPMRNYLGEPMESMYQPTAWAAGLNPFLVSKMKNDPVLEQIANIGYGFGAPSPRIKGSKYLDMRKFHNPETGRSAFDRYQEIIGEVTLGGRNIRKTLDKLFKSRAYRSANQLAERGTLKFEGTYRDPRVQAIKKVMAKFRTAAKMRTLKEYPDLLNAVKGFDKTVKDQLLNIIRM